MQQKSNIRTLSAKTHKIIFALAGLGLLALLLASCGSSNSGTTASSIAPGSSDNGSTQSQANVPQAHSASTSSGQQKSTSGQYGPQYLVKSLQVTMEVQNPLQSANDLQQWVAFTDPQSTSDGSDYENTGSGQNTGSSQYTVTLTFLVDVAHYTQVETYLRGYAGQKGHTLDSLKESVQDVTNDYVDAESTLTNLRAEQQRLLGFMNQTQNVNDAVNIEQQLTQVEGQINDIEAHLNALKGQTTFYTVTVTVQPVGSAPPPPPPSSWSAVPIWQGAWSSVVTVWQILVAILIWLLAYSVYIIPAGILIWLIRKQPWKSPLLPQMRPALAPLPQVISPVAGFAQPIEDITAVPRPIAVPPDNDSD